MCGMELSRFRLRTQEAVEITLTLLSFRALVCAWPTCSTIFCTSCCAERGVV